MKNLPSIRPARNCRQLLYQSNRQGFRLLQVLAFCTCLAAFKALGIVEKLITAGLLLAMIAADATTVFAPIHNTATFACSVTPLTLA